MVDVCIRHNHRRNCPSYYLCLLGIIPPEKEKIMSVSLCGNWGSQISFEELETMSIEPFERSGSRHAPAKHSDLCTVVDRSFDMLGYRCDNHQFYLSKDNHRMLNVFDILHSDHNLSNDEFKLVGATINTTNQTIAPHVLFGPRVFVCDNLTFCAEYHIRHKATPSLLQDMKYLVLDNILNIPFIFKEMDSRFDVMKEWGLESRSEVNDLLVRAAESGVIGFQQIPRVKTFWDEPEHDEFKGRNMYSFYNAFTSYWRKKNPFVLRQATKRLDNLCGNHIAEEVFNSNKPTMNDQYEYDYEALEKEGEGNLPI